MYDHLKEYEIERIIHECTEEEIARHISEIEEEIKKLSDRMDEVEREVKDVLKNFRYSMYVEISPEKIHVYSEKMNMLNLELNIYRTALTRKLLYGIKKHVNAKNVKYLDDVVKIEI